VLAGIALSVLLTLGHPAVGFAAATDEEPTPTIPEPTPDPAPPPAAKPKPTPKPTPKAAPRPSPVQRTPTPTPTSQPSYTPPRVVHVAPKKTVRPRTHKRAAPKKHVAVAPKPKAEVKGVNVVRTRVPVAATVSSPERDAVRRAVVITGIGIAALLFLLVVTVPATRIRFTGPGRIVMDRQTDLVLTGVAMLLLTALLLLVTK
jgi:hypothetical protein